MKFHAIFGCLVIGSVSVLGCSSTDSEPDPFATVPQFCQAWGKAACSSTTVANCAGVDKTTESLTQACVDSQQAFCETLFVGVAGYSSRNASACLSGVKSAYADGTLNADEITTVRHRGAPCDKLIKGPQGVGETCTVDDDCNTLDDYLCVIKAGAGTCQIPELVPNGDACDAPAASCNSGYYCDGDNCVASKAAGKACTDDFQCVSGLVCDPDTAKCIARVSQTDCTEDADCTTNVCSIPSGASTGKCVNTIILTSTAKLCEDLQ